MANKSATLGSGVVSGYLGVLGKQTDLPHDAVEGRDTEKVPFGGNPAPELILCERFPQDCICTHESWTIDLSSVFGFYD